MESDADMQRCLKRHLAVATFFLCLHAELASSGVHAAETPKAVELMNEGIELRRAGQDSEALPKFEDAYRIAGSPRSAAQLGLCLQALGRWSEADARLAEALKAKRDPWIAKNRTIIKDSLEQVKQNVARVEVYGGPEGSSVSVNGKLAGTYPLPGAIAVNAGNVDIEVTKPGFKRGYRAITIAGGQYQRILIRLEEGLEVAPAPVAAAPLPQAKADVVAEEEPSVIEASASDPVESKSTFQKPWFWGVVGGAVVVGVLAIALSSGGGGTKGPTVDDRGTFGP